MTEPVKTKTGVWSPVPPRVRLLILSQIFNGLTFGYFLIYVTGYLPTIGFTPLVIGTVIAIEGFSVVIAGVPFAILSDRRGRKLFVILGSALFGPTIILFALTDQVLYFYLAALVGGMGEALILGSWNAMIADQTDMTNRDASFSLSFITGTAAFSLGSSLPFLLAYAPGSAAQGSGLAYSTVLLWLGIANLASPFVLLYLLKDYREKPPDKKLEAKMEPIRQTLKFSGINSIIGLGAGLIIPLMATWLLLKFKVPPTYSGPYLALSGLTIAFSAVLSPRISRRLGLFPAIVATAGSSTFFMLSLAFVSNVFLAGGIYLIRAGLMNMNAPLMDSYLMGITPPSRRGLASMLNAVIWRVPNNASTIVGGAILSSSLYAVPSIGVTNFDLPWILAAGLYALGIGLLYLTFRHVKPSM